MASGYATRERQPTPCATAHSRARHQVEERPLELCRVAGTARIRRYHMSRCGTISISFHLYQDRGLFHTPRRSGFQSRMRSPYRASLWSCLALRESSTLGAGVAGVVHRPKDYAPGMQENPVEAIVRARRAVVPSKAVKRRGIADEHALRVASSAQVDRRSSTSASSGGSLGQGCGQLVPQTMRSGADLRNAIAIVVASA